MIATPLMIALSEVLAGNPRAGGNFWDFLLHHPVSDVGVVMGFTGIVMANKGVWNMMDAAESDVSREKEMFRTGEVTDPVNPTQGRYAAIAKYRETQPDGPYYKMLTSGQLLAAAGGLIMLFGAFI